jgi:ribitol-5-phosphate 2-dehydrogenase (NADP+) / D-ribitol-5-phosphate cytidylyltransferase
MALGRFNGMTQPGSPLRTVGVALAGGSGTRIGGEIPKQLLEIAGRSVLEHSVAAMDAAPEIDEVLVVMHPDFISEAEKVVSNGPYRKVSQVLAGGPIRSDSTRIAIAALGTEECNILLHDAVRPLASLRIIADTVDALRRYRAVGVAVPSADTILVVDDGVITDIPYRLRLWRAQTPQGFRLSLIRKAYELAGRDPDFHATDDCGVVFKYLPDEPIGIVEGSDENIKITQPLDVFIADNLLRSHQD